MAEVSDKPLAAKLGFAPGDSVYVETTPSWYSRFASENGLELEPGLPATHAHLFCARKAELADFLSENDQLFGLGHKKPSSIWKALRINILADPFYQKLRPPVAGIP